MWLLNHNCRMCFCFRIFTGSTRLDGNAIGESSWSSCVLFFSPSLPQGQVRSTYLWSAWFTSPVQRPFSLLIANIFYLFISWFCTLAVCCVHGWAGLAHTPTYVQPAKNSWDLLLQHGPHQAAVVQDLGGYRRPLQQGGWGLFTPGREIVKQKHVSKAWIQCYSVV